MKCWRTARVPAAVAVTNQRETVLLWERDTGRPVGPAIVWQCRRTEPMCEELRARHLEPLLRQKTGLTIDPLFPATKMRWLLDQAPNGLKRAMRGELCVGTMDSWLIWNLTGGASVQKAIHVCDATNASRTQLFALRELDWDDELLEIFGVPREVLPEIHPSSAIYGTTAQLGNLPSGVPLAAAIGDSHGALFGQCGFASGSIKATYGTGSSLMMPLPELKISDGGLSTTLAWLHEEQPTYALEGNIAVSGAAVQWLGEFLGLKEPARDVAALAAQAQSSGELYLVPAFVGLGAPHWNSTARGLMTGLTRGTTAADVARAALESIAYQVRDVFDAMQQESGSELRVLLADGGASANDQLMQFQADILGCTVLRNQSANLAALGAAYLAGLAMGIWSSEQEIENLPRTLDRFEPQMDAEKRTRLYDGWKKAVARTTLP